MSAGHKLVESCNQSSSLLTPESANPSSQAGKGNSSAAEAGEKRAPYVGAKAPTPPMHTAVALLAEPSASI